VLALGTFGATWAYRHTPGSPVGHAVHAKVPTSKVPRTRASRSAAPVYSPPRGHLVLAAPRAPSVLPHPVRAVLGRSLRPVHHRRLPQATGRGPRALARQQHPVNVTQMQASNLRATHENTLVMRRSHTCETGPNIQGSQFRFALVLHGNGPDHLFRGFDHPLDSLHDMPKPVWANSQQTLAVTSAATEVREIV
jgi:hypothetical protein